MTNARLVIVFLGGVLLLSVGGLIWLTAAEVNVPDILVAIPSGALGALSAFLVKSSDSPVNVQGPSTVEVDARNTDSDRGALDLGTAIIIAAAILALGLLIADGTLFR